MDDYDRQMNEIFSGLSAFIQEVNNIPGVDVNVKITMEDGSELSPELEARVNGLADKHGISEGMGEPDHD